MKLYHNPRCSKSRGALELLQQHGHDPEIVAYLEQPLPAAELRELLELLGMGARELLRTGEDEYRQLGLDDPSLDEAVLIEAMASHPRLMERPILVHRGKAIIGRPVERILEIL